MEETQQRDSLFRFADKQLGGTIVLWFRFQAHDLRLIEACTNYCVPYICKNMSKNIFEIVQHTFKI